MKEMTFAEEMSRYSELLWEREFAYRRAIEMGFKELPKTAVQQLAGAAKRLMMEAGFHVAASAEAMLPVVMIATTRESRDYLAERNSLGVYAWGVCLIENGSMDDVIVHEVVHHLQGVWTENMPSDKSVAYKDRWEESQAFLIQRAYREERNPRSFIVRLKHIWSGFTVPCCY